jgi:hypothetical protein
MRFPGSFRHPLRGLERLWTLTQGCAAALERLRFTLVE